MHSIAPWRSALARSLHLNRALADARYFQLATVSLNGRPANRTVVFRGFLLGSNLITAITDERSAKIDQIQHSPWAEICWYFPKTREQFRLSGRLNVVAQDHANLDWRKAYEQAWQNLSAAARAPFYGPSPGQPRPAEWMLAAEARSEDVPNTFRLLVFEPQAVDHLDLRSHPHDRHYYWLDPQEQWQREWLIP